MASPRQSPNGGFTIIEMTMALTVLTVVSIAVGQLFMQFSQSATAQVRQAHLTARSQVIMDRLLSELLTGQFVTMDPPIPDTSTWMRFQRPTGVVSGVVTYGDPIQIELMQADGDNFAQLRIWQDRTPTGTTPGNEDTVSIIASNVTPDGLVFNRFGAILEINLTTFDQIETGGPPEMITIVSGVRMRNSD